MTPSYSRTLATVATPEEPQLSTNSPDSEADEEEERPRHTSEIGTLKKLLNEGDTAWLGSSSGVYFVNTVRRAFADAFVEPKNGAPALPDSEDILTGEDNQGRSYNGPVSDIPSTTDGDFQRVLSSVLGSPPPDRPMAIELVTTFFRHWHPLFPFLHGPTFLKDVDTIYSSGQGWGAFPYTVGPQRLPKPITPATQLRIRKMITFQLVINIASLDRSDIQLPVESRVISTADVARIAGYISLTHDIETIQALIAASLYLIATIALRQASTVAGMTVKLIYHAGLHRCPLRYAQMSPEHCEIRKRIFWSAYAVDRHLSLSLGIPNTLQDNDIDVCLSGKELHKTKPTAPQQNAPSEPSQQPKSPSHEPNNDHDDENEANSPETRARSSREAALTAYVHYGRLTGRIIEIYHKSINFRFPKQESIIYLNSDIENWWNDLPSAFTGEEDGFSGMAEEGRSSQYNDRHRQLAPFFTILYQQLLLLLNRPRLSLDHSTAEFQHGLSVCVKASRSTLSALEKQKATKESMFLPGLLSAAWMSGLIIAFACQLGKYPKVRACADIARCQKILESMNPRWFTVQNCSKSLALLLAHLQSRKTLRRPSFGAPGQAGNSSSAGEMTEAHGTRRKRSRQSAEDLPPHGMPKRTNSMSETSPPESIDSHFVVPNAAPVFHQSPPPDHQSQRFSQNMRPAAASQVYQQTTSAPNLDYLPFNSLIPDNAGSASYINLQDMASASAQQQLSYNMLLQSPNPVDANTPNTAQQMFWNIADLYSGSSWETMTNTSGMAGQNFGDMNFRDQESGQDGREQ